MSGTQDAGSDPIEDGSLEAFDIESPDAVGSGSGPSEDDEATEKPGGLGEDGTIPSNPNGVAAGHTGEQSTFEPEEDEEADL
ncbi:hypothetical protein ACPW96_02100 [Micromonospora sp. DT81.3]|uniref:hypothetical protein n=1 Tax=Actinomycetes TaxID=1760 RepID=UPI003CE6B307